MTFLLAWQNLNSRVKSKGQCVLTGIDVYSWACCNPLETQHPPQPKSEYKPLAHPLVPTLPAYTQQPTHPSQKRTPRPSHFRLARHRSVQCSSVRSEDCAGAAPLASGAAWSSVRPSLAIWACDGLRTSMIGQVPLQHIINLQGVWFHRIIK